MRRLWDRLGLEQRLDTEAAWLGGACRPSLMVELWVALLLYGGGRMDDLRRLSPGEALRVTIGEAELPQDGYGLWSWMRNHFPTAAEAADFAPVRRSLALSSAASRSRSSGSAVCPSSAPST